MQPIDGFVGVQPMDVNGVGSRATEFLVAPFKDLIAGVPMQLIHLLLVVSALAENAVGQPGRVDTHDVLASKPYGGTFCESSLARRASPAR